MKTYRKLVRSKVDGMEKQLAELEKEISSNKEPEKVMLRLLALKQDVKMVLCFLDHFERGNNGKENS